MTAITQEVDATLVLDETETSEYVEKYVRDHGLEVEVRRRSGAYEALPYLVDRTYADRRRYQGLVAIQAFVLEHLTSRAE